MKTQILYVCSSCGEEFLRWQGKCSNCGLWNTLKEFSAKRKTLPRHKEIPQVVELAKVKIGNFLRISSNFKEFDRVLGGGIVPGSILLLGGDPGIGKSTLLLQIACTLKNVLYVSGEESLEQIKLRFDRLGLSGNLKIFSETELDEIIKAIEKEKPSIVIIDSIQSVYSQDFPSTAGSIVQVRECALRFQQLAKTTRTAVFLVGHVTKEGTVAGPRMLEHLVDVVCYLEGERFHQNRLLRTQKNRYGTTDEVGIFEMTGGGLVEVTNPSKLFLEERLADVAGNTVTATIEGTRAFLVEVQALTTQSFFGYPQRRTSGFDLNRLQLIIAVLQKRAGLGLGNHDVFVNVVGGLKIKEPAVDLAVALAVASSFKNKAIDPCLCVFGELGLSGEIRRASQGAKRQQEGNLLGFKHFIKAKNINEVVRRYCV